VGVIRRYFVRLLLLRPFLWLLAIVVIAGLVGLTFERSTSYDDGGVGTAAFLVLNTLGLPFTLLASQMGGLRGWEIYVGLALSVVVGAAPYLILDLLTVAYAHRQSAQPPRHAGA
jgi:hypothetical protein